MPNPTLASEGIDDAEFIQMLRDFMEDPPVFSPTQVTANGQNTEYRCGSFPIYDGDSSLTVTVNGVAQSLVGSRSALNAANQVYIDYETGWLFWNTTNPPAAGSQNNIQVRSSRVRWRDEKMRQALMAGLNALFPRRWMKKVDQTSVVLATNQWDYPLPGQDWYNPHTRLLEVEAQLVPAAYERFRPLDNWRRVGYTTLQVMGSQRYPAGTVLRLTWAGPYASLADLEAPIQQLPLWYAKGYLLSNKETVRVRFDQASVTQGEQANPPGVSQNAATFFMRQFEQELERVKVAMPMPRLLYSSAR